MKTSLRGCEKPSDDLLKRVRVASPCQVAWNAMAGDERMRHCSLCSLNVYNFGGMTGDEVRELLMRTEGRLCGRFYRRADGTLLTSDCPTGLRALRQRISRVAAAFIAAMFSLSAFASETPQVKKHGAKVDLEVGQAVTPQQAMFTGVVRDEAGAPLPGVSIVLKDEAVQHEITVVTNANGAFTLPSVPDGFYRVEVSLEGFRPAVLEHLLLKQNEVTQARVSLRLDDTGVVMGIIAVDPMKVTPDGPSTTFTQELINKLPI
jgi:hypothetical protein